MEGFTLTIESPPGTVPLEGPIPLTLKIAYDGAAEITILSDQFIEIEFEPPPGWTLKEKPALRHIQGWLPTETLAPGQSLSLVVYLHDHFSSIAPGKVELPVSVKIARKTEPPAAPITLREVCELDVAGPDPERFAARIAEIRQRILAQPSAEQRLELYKSLASLTHPDLIHLFLESLLDPGALMFHLTARRRAAELARAFGRNDLVVRYLADHGGRYDEEFFRLWKQSQTQLPDEEIARLCESTSLWTRLFCLEHFRQQYNRKGMIESLKTELQEISERVKDLENT